MPGWEGGYVGNAVVVETVVMVVVAVEGVEGVWQTVMHRWKRGSQHGSTLAEREDPGRDTEIVYVLLLLLVGCGFFLGGERPRRSNFFSFNYFLFVSFTEVYRTYERFLYQT